MSKPTRTVIIMTILTNEPEPGLSVGEWGHAVPPVEDLVTEGHGIGSWSVVNVETLTREQMVDALIEADNDGEFFLEEWKDEDDSTYHTQSS